LTDVEPLDACRQRHIAQSSSTLLARETKCAWNAHLITDQQHWPTIR
jgi:hypothetical protein